MILDILVFIGAIIILLLYFADKQKPIFGLAASFLLLFLGLWINVDGIQIRTGELQNTTEIALANLVQDANTTGTHILTDNTTTISELQTTGGNSTTTTSKAAIIAYTYAEIPTMAFISIQNLLSTLFILLSLYVMFTYVFEIGNFARIGRI